MRLRRALPEQSAILNELLIAWTAIFTIGAFVASFVFSSDADSPTGDGMILGLLLAVPLWPITMPFWFWYVVARHRDAERMRGAESDPESPTAPAGPSFELAPSWV